MDLITLEVRTITDIGVSLAFFFWVREQFATRGSDKEAGLLSSSGAESDNGVKIAFQDSGDGLRHDILRTRDNVNTGSASDLSKLSKKDLLEKFLAEEGHDPQYIGTPLPIDIYMRRDWNSWINSLPEKRPQQLQYL